MGADHEAVLFYSSGQAKGKKHAVNIIPSKMQYLVQRARNENWGLYSYDRIQPRSQLSIIFFDLLLKGKVMDIGFYGKRAKIIALLG